MQHFIPVTEPELHQHATDCPCGPVVKVDKESGEMYCVHLIVDWFRLFGGFVNPQTSPE